MGGFGDFLGTVFGGPIGYGAIGQSNAQDALTSAGQAELAAAQQQVKLAQDAYNQQLANRATGITTVQTAATMSPQEIASINQMLSTQSASLQSSLANLDKQQQMLNQVSPQVQAAGKDLYDLLNGKASAMLAPLQQQQQYQRQNMMNQLSSQMGPGFMQSSAGIQAMTQFDNQAAVSLNQAQMNAIQIAGSQYGALSGLQQQGQAGITGQMLNAYGQNLTTQAAASQAYAYNTQLQTHATVGAMGANPLNPGIVPQAQQSVIATSPNPFQGEVYGGQAQSAGAGSMLGMMSSMFGAAMGGGGGGGGGGSNPGGTPSPQTTQIGPWSGGYGAGSQASGYYGGGW